MLTVVKIGGSLLKDDAALPEVARSVATLSGRAVVVHGGGPEITQWQERLGLQVEWRDGLRVTTPASVQVATMVLSGWVNKRIVAAMVGAGLLAVGVSGEDGALLEAERKEGGRLGEVGDIRRVNEAVLRALLAAGATPVVSPISRGPAGAPLNVNADEAAIAIAAALRSDRLLLVSDVPGVLVDGAVLPRVMAADAEGLIKSGAVSGGMTVKLRQALVAANAGVEVRIGSEGILGDAGQGTRILPAGATVEAAGAAS